MKNHTKTYLLSWDEAFLSGTAAAGGKGWHLSCLSRYGFRVPTGRVLAAEAYTAFLQHNALQEIINGVDWLISSSETEIDTNSQLAELRKNITNGSIPPSIASELAAELNSPDFANIALAVRSSAVAEDSAQASFAGIHASSLQVYGPDSVLLSIKDCYASLWTPQAVSYRRKMNIKIDQVKMAVVIMEMVAAKAAGIGFTCDPQTSRGDVLVINANFGLGESVVNGTVDPDTYYLDGRAWHPWPQILSRKIGKKQGITQPARIGGTEFILQEDLSTQQVLTDEQLSQLGLLLQRVFESLGEGWRHQDVEWVFDGQDFVLVQARPVTALPRRTFPALQNQPDIWSNGNYRDAVPMVLSPLSRRMIKDIINEILISSIEDAGYQLPVGLQFSRLFKGRLYCNLSALQWAYFDSMGSLPRDINMFWGGHQPEIEIENPRPFRGLDGLRRIWRGLRGVAKINGFRTKAPTIHEEVVQALANVTSDDFASLNNEELITIFAKLGKIVREYARVFPFLSATGSTPMVMMIRKLVYYFPDQAFAMANGLMIGGEAAITSADHGYQLLELACIARNDEDAVRFFSEPQFAPDSWRDQLPENSPFKKAFLDFLQTYGHRAVYELDIINSRWNEDQTYLLEIIQTNLHTADLQTFRKKQKDKYQQTWQQIEKKVSHHRRVEIRKLVQSAQSGAAIREQTKSVLAQIVQAYRMLALELGNRLLNQGILKERSDVFFCTWPELIALLSGQWDGHGITTLITTRKAARQEMETFAAPDVIFGDKPQTTRPVAPATGNHLTGVAVAGGKAIGTARHINHPEEGKKLQPGEIMVSPSTDPGWTPLFLQAGGLIMETGGFLSHGAIVAREYGIPAVVNVPGVMQIVRDGMNVTVDGDEGRVFLQ